MSKKEKDEEKKAPAEPEGIDVFAAKVAAREKEMGVKPGQLTHEELGLA